LNLPELPSSIAEPGPIMLSMTRPTYTPGVFSKSTVIVGSAKPKPPVFVIRPRHIIGALACLLSLIVLYLCGYEPAYEGKLVIHTPRPLIIASHNLGDNPQDKSVSAVDHALNAGADGVAVRGQLTPDGTLGIFMGDAYLGTFPQFVRSVNGRGLAMVVLDAPGLASSGVEQRAVDIIQRFDAHLSVVLGSFNPLVLRRVKEIDPLVRTAFVFTDSRENAPEGLTWMLRQEFFRCAVRKFVTADMLSIDYRVNDDITDHLIAKGWPALVWGPATEPELRGVIARHPYAVISDQPTLARGLRGN
jgi:glycerophosphoryl diester phosphodiesterase